ncbi:MAG: hypothetical protein PHR28_05000 [candidate division Zixibacteria bacterium]|nr:hypothetical protein [candidate division Zixibacteria bacterium]
MSNQSAGSKPKLFGLYTLVIVVAVFAVAMAYVEAAVVVYLRGLFYPDGFSLPLKVIPGRYIAVELFRELATMVMIATVAGLAGKRFWERFGYFLILFGVWDIFYYVWLAITLGWPVSLMDWDILFLIPLPWIGPVIAPVAISCGMIIAGYLIIRRFASGGYFRATWPAWILSLGATAIILSSFMGDTDATLRLQQPRPYHYGLLVAGLVLYGLAFVHAYLKSRPVSSSPQL